MMVKVAKQGESRLPKRCILMLLSKSSVLSVV